MAVLRATPGVRLEQDLDAVRGRVPREAVQDLRREDQRLAYRDILWERSTEDAQRRRTQVGREIHHELAFPHGRGAASRVSLNELAGGVQRRHTQSTRTCGLDHAP